MKISRRGLKDVATFTQMRPTPIQTATNAAEAMMPVSPVLFRIDAVDAVAAAAAERLRTPTHTHTRAHVEQRVLAYWGAYTKG